MEYKSKDVIKLIDTFQKLSEQGVDGLEEAMTTLTQYPPKVIQTFLEGIEMLGDKYTPDMYMGIIGFLTMKLNFIQD